MPRASSPRSTVRPVPRLRSLIFVLRIPALFIAAYFLLAVAGVFSPLFWVAHLLALAVFIFWVVKAVHALWVSGVFSLHLRYGLFFTALVIAGSCWGMPGAVDLRAWVTPPSYTGLPSSQLSTSFLHPTEILAGSVVHVSYDGQDKVQVFFDRKEELLASDDSGAAMISFLSPEVKKTRQTTLFVHRFWHRFGLWSVRLIPDKTPQIKMTHAPKVTMRKTVCLTYRASDDFGVSSIAVRVTPLEASVVRAPADVVLVSASRRQVSGAVYAELASLPWAGKSVSLQLIASDSAGNKAWSKPHILTLPARRFRNPFALALIEERENLLRDPSTAVRNEAANVMAGIARQQAKFMLDTPSVLMLRSGAVRLILSSDERAIKTTANLLWRTALRFEEGTVGTVREVLAKAERNLSSALLLPEAEISLGALLVTLSCGADAYFGALKSEKSRAFQEFANFSLNAQELSSHEDFQNHLDVLATSLKEKDWTLAQRQLAQMREVIENLPTTPPELSPDQDNLALQLSALRTCIQAQKMLLDKTKRLMEESDLTKKARQKKKEATGRLATNQRHLLSALGKAVARTNLVQMEVKDSKSAMEEAAIFLEEFKLTKAQKQQAQALALLENSLLILSERMKQSLVAAGFAQNIQ